MTSYSYTTLRVDGHYFDTWALHRAYTHLNRPSKIDVSEFEEEALEALLGLFCDWSPARIYDSPKDAYPTLNTTAANTLTSLNEEQKRELYHNCCEKISQLLRNQYDIEATEADIKRFAETLTADAARKERAEFLLEFLTAYSKYLAEFDPVNGEHDTDTPLQDFLNTIRDLPDEYLDVKQTQYEGESKIRAIRRRVAETFLSGEELPTSRFHELCQEEDEKHDTAIMTGYSPYSVLGQLYYDYTKLRINGYLERLITYLQDELDIESHSQHTCNFIEPRNQLTQSSWTALHPGLHPGKEDYKDEYQFYLGIRPSQLSYGLHVGSNLRDDDEWEQERDLRKHDTTESVSIDDILDKLRAVKDDYMVLNGLKEARPKDAETFARQLQQNGQLVFYGPPGTGKTYQADQFAKWWTSEGPSADDDIEQFRAVTFHPSFAYEDFLEGLSADATDEGMVEYEMDAGIFKNIANDAKEAYENASNEAPPRFVLVIDEINRGNLAQIFGETITQLEADKRLDAANELEVTLAHSGDSFVVPPNLFIIGTMNTADRSIALVDAALRRRFRFINFPPDYDALYEEYNFDHKRDVHATAESSDSLRALLALSLLALEELNERIRSLPDLGKGKQIGHSYLFGCTRDDGHIDEDALVDTWKYEILPLLEEYYFGQFERIEQDLLAGTDDRLVDWRTKQIKDFTTDDLHTALASLLNIEPGTTSRQTVDILSENGVLESGDILEFNREQLRNGTTVSDADIERAEAERDAAFWQSKVIDATAESGEIRWLNDGDLYSLSGAAQQIFTELTNGDKTTAGQPDHWCHPQFNNRNLYQLRDNGVDGTDRSVPTE